MTLTITKKEILEYERLKLISKIAPIEDRIKQLSNKYEMKFVDFEKHIHKKGEERYGDWEDFIEWKAYRESLKELKKKLRDLQNVKDIKITD